MAALGSKLRTLEGGGISFYCPGCKQHHSYWVGEGKGPWTWNADAELPTFKPSLLNRSGHYIPEQERGGAGCWCTYNAEHPNDPAPFACGVCHLLLTDGQLQFLGDCTHGLAGQTVPLPDYP